MSRACATVWPFLLVVLLAALPARASEIDPLASEAGFELVTRWGELVLGRFPVLEGRLTRLDDGRRRVRVSLSATHVEIVGSRRHSYFARGRGFFDAERYPWVTFESDPFDARLLAEGGSLPGVLHIRDVQRREVFIVAPSACDRPALDCPVRVAGVIDRGHYGMNRWTFAIAGKVRFEFRIHLAREAE